MSEMSERQRNCRVCDSWGCSRCADEPGEQGLSGDEKELLQLRDRVRALEAKLAEVTLEWVPMSIARKGASEGAEAMRHKILDAVMAGFMGDPRSTLTTEAALRELVRRLR